MPIPRANGKMDVNVKFEIRIPKILNKFQIRMFQVFFAAPTLF